MTESLKSDNSSLYWIPLILMLLAGVIGSEFLSLFNYFKGVHQANTSILDLLLVNGIGMFFWLFHLRKGIELRPNFIDTILFCFVCLNFLSAFWAVNFAESIESFIFVFTTFHAYLIFRVCLVYLQADFFRYISFFASFLVIGVSLTFLASGFIQYEGPQEVKNIYSQISPYIFANIQGLVGSKNLTGTYLFLLWGLVCFGFTHGKISRVISGLSSLLIIATIFIISCRSALLACLILGIGLLAISKLRKQLMLYGLLLIALMATYFFFADTNLILTRFIPEYVIESHSFQWRMTMWNKTLELSKEAPIIGHGIGQWEIYFSKLGTIDPARPFRNFVHAHNDYLINFFELGTLGILFFISIFIGILFWGIKRFSQANAFSSNWNLWVCLLSIVAVLAIMFMESLKYRLPQQCLLMLYIAIIASYGFTTNSEKRSLSSIISIIGVLLSILVSIWGITVFNGKSNFKEIRILSKEKNWEGMLEIVEKSYSPFLNSYRKTPLLYYKALALEKQEKLDLANEFYKQGLKTHPYHQSSLSNIGRLYLSQEKTDSAKVFLDRCYHISPHFQPMIYQFAELNILLEEPEQAEEWIAQLKKKNQQRKLNAKLKELRP